VTCNKKGSFIYGRDRYSFEAGHVVDAGLIRDLQPDGLRLIAVLPFVPAGGIYSAIA
jgi:hypothetical protein